MPAWRRLMKHGKYFNGILLLYNNAVSDQIQIYILKGCHILVVEITQQ